MQKFAFPRAALFAQQFGNNALAFRKDTYKKGKSILVSITLVRRTAALGLLTMIVRYYYSQRVIKT